MNLSNESPEEKIRAWFRHALESSGKKDKEIAEELNVTPATISKIKTGNQHVSAYLLLAVHEKLNTPLPRLSKQEPVISQDREKQQNFTQLFDLAYDQIHEQERRKPETERMSQYSMLSAVFHVLKSLKENSEGGGDE